MTARDHDALAPSFVNCLLALLALAAPAAAVPDVHGAPAAAPPPVTAGREAHRLWCSEHGVYEDECAICHPELAAAPHAAQPHGLLCKEHRVPESECGICHPEMIATRAPGHGLKVRFASPESAVKAGVQTALPEIGCIAAAVECYAELAFDQNRFAQVVAPVRGIIQSVDVDLGRRVESGSRLATLWSTATAEATSAYVRAMADAALRRQTLARERRLRTAQVSAEKDLQEAEAANRAAVAAVQEARQHLATLGFRDANLSALTAQPGSPAALEVRAPFTGEIIQRSAVPGALVEAGSTLFSIADPTVMWAMLSIPEASVFQVEVGQHVEIAFEALPHRAFRGAITWIAPQVDAHTRLATARAEVPNPDGMLKAGMFARARIVASPAADAVVVPASALQHIDGKPWLFVKLEDDLYDARPVLLGTQRDGRIAILAGVGAQDRVVVDHSFAVKSELLKSRLGAGCVDE